MKPFIIGTYIMCAAIIVLMGLFTHNINNQLKQIESKNYVVKTTTQKVQMTCTGTLNENLTGTTVPTNSSSPDSTLLGSNVKLSATIPVSLNCY